MAETQYVLTVTVGGKKEMIALPSGGVAAHNQAWSTITDTPTTLAGYGITDGGGSMTYPGAGIPLSTGSAWGTSITDNSANWNAAYGWGDHAGLYSLLAHNHNSDYLGITAKAADSDKLDGYHATDFLGISGKAADSDKLDGEHGSYYAPINNPTITGTAMFSGTLIANNNVNIGPVSYINPASPKSIFLTSYYTTKGISQFVGNWQSDDAYGIGPSTGNSDNTVRIGRTDPSSCLWSVTQETNLIIGGVYTANGGNSTDWNEAHGWGNHASAGYASLTNPTFIGTVTVPSLIVEDLTDGFIPYQKASDDKISNSTIYFDGTNYGFGTINGLSFISINGGVHIGGDSDAGDNNLLVDGTIKGESLESVTTFSTGFNGNGYKILESGGISSLEVDNLRVRNTLFAYELDINKISSINGGLVISIANGTSLSVSGTTIYFDEDNGNKPIQFAVDDYIRAQIWTGRGIASYIGKVTQVNHSNTFGSANIVATTISGTAWNVMELVQIGNSSDTARQSAIYLTASDTNNPYIDLLSDVDAGVFTHKQKVRIGNLTGCDAISGIDGTPSGYGLYAQNVFLSGKIVATEGKIAGWRLWSNGLYLNSGVDATSCGMAPSDYPFYAGKEYVDRATAPFRVTTAGAMYSTSGEIGGFTIGATDLYAGSGVTRVQMGSGTGFWAGATAFANAPFSVSPSGELKATGVAEIGTKVGADGYNVAIKEGQIWENSKAGTSILMINYKGYNGGTDYYRNTHFYDGKNNLLFSVNGQTPRSTVVIGNSVDFYVNSNAYILGNIEIDGSIRHDGATTFNGTALFSNTAEFDSTAQFDSTSTFNGNVTINAQVGIGGSPTGDILLNLVSSTKAFCVSRMTTAQRNAMTPSNGMIIYDTTVDQFCGYNASGWFYFTQY